jgi:hypothetical protein
MKCANPRELSGSRYEIHRMEHRRLGADLSKDPALSADGTTIGSVDVQLWRWERGKWIPAEDKFGDPAPTPSDGLVAFWVRPPQGSDPAPAGNHYGISVEAEISTGEVIYGEWGLCLRGGASE